MSTASSAIVYLTQNTPERRHFLQTSLYFLFRNFNSTRRYPVIIFHEGDYDTESQQAILDGIRRPHQTSVSFRRLEGSDFTVPSHLDRRVVARTVSLQIVPWWRDARYRMMCRWWLVHMPRYLSEYDYIMRLDDDSIIEEPIRDDLFDIARARGLVYLSNQVHLESPICSYGMREFMAALFPDRRDAVNDLFYELDLPIRAEYVPALERLKRLSEMGACQLPRLGAISAGKHITLSAPVMFYNNFHITAPRFWMRPDVARTVAAIDHHGGIFHARWGDAPLQTLVVILHAEARCVGRYPFKYSKRRERTSFDFGNNHRLPHSQVYYDYNESGCITEDGTLSEWLSHRDAAVAFGYPRVR